MDPGYEQRLRDEGNVDDTSKHTENLEKMQNVMQGSCPSPISSTQWSCSSSTGSEWPSSTLSKWPSLMKCSLLAEEQKRFAAVQLQQKLSEAFREFCAGNAASDNDEDEGKVGSECEEFKFFLKVFEENGDLRTYYENNFEDGEFCCLVCGEIGKKEWRRFKDGLGLLQHSLTIKNTKYKRAHRAYGQVICKVLGWDIDQDCVEG